MKIPFWLAKILLWHPSHIGLKWYHSDDFEGKILDVRGFWKPFNVLFRKLWMPIGPFFQEGYIGTKNALFILVWLTEIEEAYLLLNFQLFTETNGITCVLKSKKVNDALTRDYEKPLKELAAKLNNVSLECASNIKYLRTRSYWSQDIENKLILMDKETGKQPNNINDWLGENSI